MLRSSKHFDTCKTGGPKWPCILLLLRHLSEHAELESKRRKVILWGFPKFFWISERYDFAHKMQHNLNDAELFLKLFNIQCKASTTIKQTKTELEKSLSEISLEYTSDLQCGVYTMFRLISIERYIWKSLSSDFRGTKFEIFREHVLK